MDTQEWRPDITTSTSSFNTENSNIGSNSPVRKKVFLVDDEPDIVFTIQTVLEENGYMVDCYDKPREALDHFKPDEYDAAILDVRMPEMNGFELYRRLRERDNRIRICFLTAIRSFSEYGEEDELSATWKEEHFIQKPVSNHELIEKIDAMLRTTTASH